MNFLLFSFLIFLANIKISEGERKRGRGVGGDRGATWHKVGEKEGF